jgi:hypothetical protein
MFLTPSSHDKGPTTDWIVGFYCPKVPLSIGTTLGALRWVVPKSVFHTPGSRPPITPNPFGSQKCVSYPGVESPYNPFAPLLNAPKKVTHQGCAAAVTLREGLVPRLDIVSSTLCAQFPHVLRPSITTEH